MISFTLLTFIQQTETPVIASGYVSFITLKAPRNPPAVIKSEPETIHVSDISRQQTPVPEIQQRSILTLKVPPQVAPIVKSESKDDDLSRLPKAQPKAPRGGRKAVNKPNPQAGAIFRHVVPQKRIRLKLNINSLRKENVIAYLFLVNLPAPDIGPTAPETPGVRRAPKGYWDNATYRVKFGNSLFTNHLAPTHKDAEYIYDTLAQHLRERETPIIVERDGTSGVGTNGPAHGQQSLTIDCIVRTIMSQGTSNDNAMKAHQKLRERFPCISDGDQTANWIPNYHDVRVCPKEELSEVIQCAGFHIKRAQHILAALDIIYKKNIELRINPKTGSLPEGTEMGQDPEALCFAPGLLSIDFLSWMGMKEVFNFLVNIPGIGVKTTHCILSFNLGFPLCAVDTHVMKMVTWLGWIPESVKSEIVAFNHIDARLPDEIKLAVHQVFWHHCQQCSRCKRKAARDDIRPNEEACPIEELLQRTGGMGSRTPRRVSDKTSPDGKEKASKTKPKPKPKPTTKIVMKPFDHFSNEADARAEGFSFDQYPVDDNFDARGANVKWVKRWVKREAISVKVEVKLEASDFFVETSAKFKGKAKLTVTKDEESEYEDEE
jgi:endonuclease III